MNQQVSEVRISEGVFLRLGHNSPRINPNYNPKSEFCVDIFFDKICLARESNSDYLGEG